MRRTWPPPASGSIPHELGDSLAELSLASAEEAPDQVAREAGRDRDREGQPGRHRARIILNVSFRLAFFERFERGLVIRLKLLHKL